MTPAEGRPEGATPLAVLCCWCGGFACLLASRGLTWRVTVGVLVLAFAACLTVDLVRRRRRS